ncbi:patatin-like phospholipase family protein [Spirosoma pomorum]
MGSVKQTGPSSLEPLSQIGLAVSGGGFRAAAFGLGCLSYLDHCSLLDSTGEKRSLREAVTFMSTTSGGSFLSLLYAENLYQGKSFAHTYEQLRALMDGEKLLSDAMRILKDPDAWTDTPTKQRNLINAYALALTDSQRLGKATFDPLCQPDNDLPHLRQICVNATEFKNGLSFRFQNVDGQQRKGFVGNYVLHFRRSALPIIRKIRLADILAASSCFPAGFEPIMFPRDFAYRGETTEKSLSEQELQQAMLYQDAPTETAQLTSQFDSVQPSLAEVSLTLKAEQTEDSPAVAFSQSIPQKQSITFGIMDGGIDDNQGIQGLILGDYRAQTSGHPFDTLIACDVSSPLLDDYEAPAVNNRGWRQLSLLKLTFLAAIALVGLPFIWGALYADPDKRNIFITFAGTMTLLLGGGLLGLWYGVRQIGGKGTWGPVIRTYGDYFLRIPFGSLWQMIAARTSSVVLLSGDVFMKQIRRLIYQQFYTSDTYKNRRMTVLIYELSTTYYKITKARNKQWSPSPAPSETLMDIAEKARTMDTTLWFSKSQLDMRDNIIATGQFTMCYNLMAYLNEMRRAPLSPAYRAALEELNVQLEADWKRFCSNPLWLVDAPMSAE